MYYAVIVTGGKQYRVSVGDIIEADRLPVAENAEVVFDNVLLFVSGKETKIGTPTLSGVKVVGKVLGNIKGEKIRVSKFKAKSRHRRTIGFRAFLSKIQITQVGDEKLKEASEIVKKEEAEKPKRSRKKAE